METIKNYLDAMFANLPNKTSVIKAKDELWQMMEDKFNELIAEGKTENEAVGTVISEFGNLSELAEVLGLEDEVGRDEAGDETETEAERFTKDEEPAIVIARDEAENLLKESAERSTKISLGIALCVMSPVLGIISEAVLNGKGGFINFLLVCLTVAAGVIMIVLGVNAGENWKKYSKKKCTLSMDATKFVAEEKAIYDRSHTLVLTVGILLFVVSWIPAVIISNVIPTFDDLGGAFFFICVGIGVLLVVYSSLRSRGYESLLKLNGSGTIKYSYEPEEQGEYKYISPIADFCMSIYWPFMTCLYLILSFTTMYWGLTWIIWPVAGVLHRPLKKALRYKEQ